MNLLPGVSLFWTTWSPSLELGYQRKDRWCHLLPLLGGDEAPRITGLETSERVTLKEARQQQELPAVRRGGCQWSLEGHRSLHPELPKLPSQCSPYLLMDVLEMLAEAGML